MNINRIKESDFSGEILRRLGIYQDDKRVKLKHKPKTIDPTTYFTINPYESEHSKGI